MSFRLLIDECLSPELVALAMAAGHVESTCARDRNLLGATDWRLLDYVVSKDFTLVTHNARDFRGPGGSEPGGLYGAVQIHAGLICLESQRPRPASPSLDCPRGDPVPGKGPVDSILICTCQLAADLMRATQTTEIRAEGRAARLEARVTADQKRMLQHAAALSGRTLSEFVVASAQEAAAKVIEAYETIRLTREEQIAFVSTLLNPPLPNARLRRAAAKYRHTGR
jgi:uncharacterized protein (DUF1778 family)